MTKRLVTTLSVLLFFTAIADATNAQAQNPGNPTVLGAVQDLQAAVAALATSQQTNIANQLTSIASQLTSLTNTVNALNTPPTVIGTALIFKPSAFGLLCEAQNIGDTTVTLTMDLMGIDGLVKDTFDLTLPAGQGNGVGFASIGTTGNFWCRFTMTTGSSAKIRGRLEIPNPATGLSIASLEAR